MRWLLVLLVFTVELPRAVACICTPNGGVFYPGPRSEAPPNLAGLLVGAGSRSVRLYRGTQEIELGAPTTLSLHALFLPIVESLVPDTTYRIVGENPLFVQQIDQEFTTGQVGDVTPPSLKPISLGARIVGSNGTSCPNSNFVFEGELVGSPDTVAIATRFTRADGDSVEYTLPTYNARQGLQGIGSGTCQNYLRLEEDETVSVEAWAIDAAGNTGDVQRGNVTVEVGCSTSSPGTCLVLLVLFGCRRRVTTALRV